MIRVTPIGGEPVELAEDTLAIECRATDLRVEVNGTPVPFATILVRVFGTGGAAREHRFAQPLHHIAHHHGSRHFVHIGDAWPLCEIETWRARAERLERELAAKRPAYRIDGATERTLVDDEFPLRHTKLAAAFAHPDPEAVEYFTALGWAHEGEGMFSYGSLRCKLLARFYMHPIVHEEIEAWVPVAQGDIARVATKVYA